MVNLNEADFLLVLRYFYKIILYYRLLQFSKGIIGFLFIRLRSNHIINNWS